MTVLDLFSGTGSATKPLEECGRHGPVVRIDNAVHSPARVPHLRCDVRALPKFVKPPIEGITAGPPCTDFSPLTKLAAARGFRPSPDPEKGMELVRATKMVIDRLKPTWWVVENVRGSVPYISQIFGKPKLGWAGRWLWTSFEFQGFMPANLDSARKCQLRADQLPEATWRIRAKAKEPGMRDNGEGWSAVRAMWPRPLSEAVHRAVCGEA